MALWPFGKKKDTDASATGKTENKDAEKIAKLDDQHEVDTDAVIEKTGDATAPEEQDQPPTSEENVPPVREHDAVNGQIGPYDGDQVSVESFDFSDFSDGMLNLGSIQVAMPKEAQVQVEMGEDGPRMLHIVTRFGRITPVAFAAPRAGQWDEASREIREGMTNDGLTARFDEGPWGREIVGTAGPNTMRIIGIDGPRWMLRFTLAAPNELANDLAQLSRDVIARTFVYRGTQPILAGNSLPIALPPALVEQLQAAMTQRAEEARIQNEQQNAHDENAIAEANQALRNLNGAEAPETPKIEE